MDFWIPDCLNVFGLPRSAFLIFALQNIHCSINHSDHINSIHSNVVYDSVRSGEYLPDLFKLIFRNFASRQWKFTNLLWSPCNTIYRVQRIGFRVLCDVCIYGIQMRLGRFGLVNFHSGNPYFFLISATSFVLPALLSSIPFSIVSLTYISCIRSSHVAWAGSWSINLWASSLLIIVDIFYP